jgi:predicted transcriptional regulator
MSEEQKQQGNQINIELTEEIADGIYSNLAIISHSQSEFILDFVRILPGVNKAKVKSRIILTPQHAKRLQKALSENIEKFQKSHGDIEDNEVLPGMPMNFGGNTAQA